MGSVTGSSLLASRAGFMFVVGAVVLGFSTLYTCFWLVVVCVVGGSKGRLCGINSGRFVVISSVPEVESG